MLRVRKKQRHKPIKMRGITQSKEKHASGNAWRESGKIGGTSQEKDASQTTDPWVRKKIKAEKLLLHRCVKWNEVTREKPGADICQNRHRFTLR